MSWTRSSVIRFSTNAITSSTTLLTLSVVCGVSLAEHRASISKHLIGAVTVVDNVFESAAHLVEIGRRFLEPVQPCAAPCDNRRQGLPDFMSN
jgi:hypothetical protein